MVLIVFLVKVLRRWLDLGLTLGLSLGNLRPHHGGLPMLKAILVVGLLAFTAPAIADLVPGPEVLEKTLKDENLAYLFALMPEKSNIEIGKLGNNRVTRRIFRAERQFSGRNNRLIQDHAIVCYKEEIYPAQKFNFDTKYFCHDLSTQNAELPADDKALVKLINSKRVQR